MILFFGDSSVKVFAVKCKQPLTIPQKEKLSWLFSDQPLLKKEIILGDFYGPRATMVTPWSTNAVEIAQNMGISGIERIEFYEAKKIVKNPDPMLLNAFDSLNQEIFESVSAALETQESAAILLPLLEKAEKHLDIMRDKAGGDPIKIIGFLLETTVEEYSVGVRDGKLTDVGEYQDAFGFVLVAAEHARRLSKTSNERLLSEILSLQDYWLRGPLPVETPTPAEDVALTVNLILSQL